MVAELQTHRQERPVSGKPEATSTSLKQPVWTSPKYYAGIESLVNNYLGTGLWIALENAISAFF